MFAPGGDFSVFLGSVKNARTVTPGLEIVRAVLDHLAPELPAGHSVSVTLQLSTPSVAGPFTNQAQVAAFSHDFDLNDNQASVTVEASLPPEPGEDNRVYLPLVYRR